jgi:hypothetical protein
MKYGDDPNGDRYGSKPGSKERDIELKYSSHSNTRKSSFKFVPEKLILLGNSLNSPNAEIPISVNN